MRVFGVTLGILMAVVFTQPAFAAKGSAMIKGTAEGSTIAGEIQLTETNGGLDVMINVVNVPPGKHGFHIHEKGDCSDTGKAAGGHYNPDGAPHGLVTKDGFTHAHPGDLGNIEVGTDGTGTLKAFVPGLTLEGGKYNVSGKAVILHEKEDDFSQPTGNAGARIGCGVIAVTEMAEVPEAMEQGMNQDDKAKEVGEAATDQVGQVIEKTATKAPDAVTEKMEPISKVK